MTKKKKASPYLLTQIDSSQDNNVSIHINYISVFIPTLYPRVMDLLVLIFGNITDFWAGFLLESVFPSGICPSWSMLLIWQWMVLIRLPSFTLASSNGAPLAVR